MPTTLALAGDTMLGRGVAEKLLADPAAALIAPEVEARIAAADCFVLNLECCISERGTRFADPAKPFFFRAPPVAAQRLAELGVDAVTLANNHALDYGPDALLDTLAHLDAVEIATIGAGRDEGTARTPGRLSCGDLELGLVAFSDHPAAYAAGPERPGIAFAELGDGLPGWVKDAVGASARDGLVLATPHWGPNMLTHPGRRIRAAAEQLLDAGAGLIAGHSAHVFQGVAPSVLFDLGDFVDDYAVDPQLRNDLGLLWLVELEPDRVARIRALPLFLEYCFTRRASPAETASVVRLLGERCARFGTEVQAGDDGLIELRTRAAAGSA